MQGGYEVWKIGKNRGLNWAKDWHKDDEKRGQGC